MENQKKPLLIGPLWPLKQIPNNFFLFQVFAYHGHRHMVFVCEFVQGGLLYRPHQNLAKSMIPLIILREGLKKKHVFYPHFVDKGGGVLESR